MVTTPTNEMAALQSLEKLVGQTGCTPEGICTLLGQVFCVRPTEVGLLRLEGQALKFLYPAELQVVGTIPISSSAVAARTASTRKAGLFNNFVQVRHHDIFESIILRAGGGVAQTIQKLISAPIITAHGQVAGVVQISRKGPTPAAAGPDFGQQDLNRLLLVSNTLAILMPRIQSNERGRGSKLQFRSCTNAGLSG